MEMFNDLFKKDLIFTDFRCIDKYDCFEKVAEQLEQKGYVRNSFENAIKERESNYPTGLYINPYQVAIPHTDPEHVLKAFIAVVKPRERLKFFEMGSEKHEINAHILFILGITKSERQVILLQNLIELFQKREIMDELLRRNDCDSIYQLLKNNIDIKGGIYS